MAKQEIQPNGLLIVDELLLKKKNGWKAYISSRLGCFTINIDH